jgi:hypothetical protein
MRFQPKTENEIASDGLFPPGTYDFEVLEAEEQTSSKGNDMIMLKLAIYNAQGQNRHVYDYLVGTDGAQFKIRHYAEATGQLDTYDGGEISADDQVGRTGRCKIVIKKDASGQYADKNAVSDYVRSERTAAAPAKRGATAGASPAEAELDDSIPF